MRTVDEGLQNAQARFPDFDTTTREDLMQQLRALHAQPGPDPWVEIWGGRMARKSHDTGETADQGHPYFCLACQTIEVYDEVPVDASGQPKLPWHNHGAETVRMHPLMPEEVVRAVAYGARLVRHGQRTTPRRVTPSALPDPVGARVQAVLAKVAKEGW
jgi:hypothetical protein